MYIWRVLKLNFDRSFSVARFRQFTWLIVFLFVSFAAFYGINKLLGEKIKHPARIVELMLDPGAFVYQTTYEPLPQTNVPPTPAAQLSPSVPLLPNDANNPNVAADPAAASVTAQPAYVPTPGIAEPGNDGQPVPAGFPEELSLRHRLFHLIIALFGAVFFTGMLISVISNMLEGRVAAYKKGLVRYPFSDHILILGANEMVVNMVKAFASHPKTARRDIVVLSNTDIEQLRSRLYSELDTRERRNLTLLFGSRDSDEELRRVQVLKAFRVYILGECDEVEHDAVNIACYERVKTLCALRREVMKCYLVINNVTSFHVFQYRRNENDPHLELTIINSLENWAQQVLVSHRHERMVYPALDREGIGADSDKSVHFVVVGMTQMALAMATTAAHIAHYPNFRTRRRRTRISFISPQIEQEMNFFKGHYRNLFDLSHSTLRTWNYDGREKEPVVEVPQGQYGDFLDVEWEFIDGGIETPQVRELIRRWCTHRDYADEILTFAVCGKDPVANIAAALYLPVEIEQRQVPVFVYQPNMGKILELANKTLRYAHVFPFGMKHDCYDPALHDCIVNAKRINYLYNKAEEYVTMPAGEDELDRMWYGLSFANQLSNIYAANSIPGKLRSLGWSGAEFAGMTEEQVDLLAEVEHNRWNVEKLLVGFRAMPRDRRTAVSAKEAVRLKKECFIHKDIAPYDELSESSRRYDRVIVRHIGDVISR